MAKNQAIVDAIINGASPQFKSLIPDATQLSVAEFGTAVLANPDTRNEALNALINRIGFTFLSSEGYKNPLSSLNKGKVAHGDRVQEIFVERASAQEYDAEKAENEIYKRVQPAVSVIYHVLNRTDFYKITVQEATFRKAFIEENGLQNLINGIIESMTTGDEHDTFLLTKQLIQMYGTEGRFYPITVPAPIDESSVRQIMVKIKGASNKLTFMNSAFNDAGVYTHTPKNKQIIFIDTDFDAQVDVELLAQAFNMSQADFNARKIVIDDFGGLTNVACVLCDEKFFQIYDTLYETRNKENEQGLFRNWWLHHWQTLSTSRFANAIIFQTTTPTVATVELTPETVSVAKGGTEQFFVTATGTNNPPSKCTYEVDGTDSYISPVGLLQVGKNETVSPLTVTATNAFNPVVFDTATVTVI